MASNPAVPASSKPFTMLEVLCNPWVDRVIAIIAVVPIVWLSKYRFDHMKLGLPLFTLALNTLILVLTMVLRRPPKRITPNPVYWLLAFVATYWPILTLGVFQRGEPIMPNTITDALAILSLLVLVWARLSLGRNIGFVPAQRQIVTTGVYRFMRHPIYTGLFLAYTGLGLRAYTPRNALILGLGIGWYCIKSVVEEGFLRADPEYAAYLQRVRARWVPFVV